MCATIPLRCEKLLDLFHKAGETTHITEVIELLAHASVQSGDLPRARDLYQKLATMEPGNPLHMNNYQQVVSQIGGRLRRQAHFSGRSCRHRRRAGSHGSFDPPTLFRCSRARGSLRAHRRRTFHFLQHARQGAGAADGCPAAGSERSSPEPAAGRAAHARRAFRRSRRLLPHFTECLLRSRISRRSHALRRTRRSLSRSLGWPRSHRFHHRRRSFPGRINARRDLSRGSGSGSLAGGAASTL